MALARFVVLLLIFIAVELSEAASPPWVEARAGAEFVGGEVILKFREGARSSRTDVLAVGNVSLRKLHELAFGAELWKIEEMSLGNNSERSRQNLSQKTLDVVEALRLTGDVQYVHRNAVFELSGNPYDEYYPLQWNLAAIGYSEAMDHAAEGVAVAVIDTGRLDHPDLSGKWLPGIDATTYPFGSNVYDNSGNV